MNRCRRCDTPLFLPSWQICPECDKKERLDREARILFKTNKNYQSFSKKQSEERDLKIILLLEEGKNVNYIAREINRSYEQTRQYIRYIKKKGLISPLNGRNIDATREELMSEIMMGNKNREFLGKITEQHHPILYCKQHDYRYLKPLGCRLCKNNEPHILHTRNTYRVTASGFDDSDSFEEQDSDNQINSTNRIQDEAEREHLRA